MPLYEYECGQCGNKFEMRKRFTEGASAECPECRATAQRVFSPVPIVFKGSGFYVNDYPKDGGCSGGSCTPSAESGSCNCGSGCSCG